MIGLSGTPEIFSFSDFDLVPAGCHTVYSLTYSLLVDGADVTDSLPNWIIDFTPTSPQFTVESSPPDRNDEGTYIVTVKSYIELNPTNKDAETQINYTQELESDACSFSSLSPLVLYGTFDYMMTPRQIPEPSIIQFDEVTQSLDFCGPIVYTLTPDGVDFMDL